MVGWFDIEKPYFNLDATRMWRELGVERHKGVEASLAGEVARGLSMVAGYVRQTPRVEGEAVRLGLIGDRPVGQPRDTARVSLDYRPFGTPVFSVDAAFSFYGARPVSPRGYAALGGRQLALPGNVTLDLGLRRRFEIAGRPATLRAQLQNVGGKGGWVANTAGGLSPITPRRLFVALTADL
nr:TonB-dependent receptor [Phenylobacterium immobile]